MGIPIALGALAGGIDSANNQQFLTDQQNQQRQQWDRDSQGRALVASENNADGAAPAGAPSGNGLDAQGNPQTPTPAAGGSYWPQIAGAMGINIPGGAASGVSAPDASVPGINTPAGGTAMAPSGSPGTPAPRRSTADINQAIQTKSAAKGLYTPAQSLEMQRNVDAARESSLKVSGMQRAEDTAAASQATMDKFRAALQPPPTLASGQTDPQWQNSVADQIIKAQNNGTQHSAQGDINKIVLPNGDVQLNYLDKEGKVTKVSDMSADTVRKWAYGDGTANNRGALQDALSMVSTDAFHASVKENREQQLADASTMHGKAALTSAGAAVTTAAAHKTLAQVAADEYAQKVSTGYFGAMVGELKARANASNAQAGEAGSRSQLIGMQVKVAQAAEDARKLIEPMTVEYSNMSPEDQAGPKGRALAEKIDLTMAMKSGDVSKLLAATRTDSRANPVNKTSIAPDGNAIVNNEIYSPVPGQTGKYVKATGFGDSALDKAIAASVAGGRPNTGTPSATGGGKGVGVPSALGGGSGNSSYPGQMPIRPYSASDAGIPQATAK